LAAVTPCVALEDSLLGAEAAKAAGCWTVGVATGASDFERLSSSPYVDRCYACFAPCRVVLGREGVTKKSLVTPNEFVSHMIEHIAWRLGCSIDVFWANDDWFQLGRELGHRIAELCPVQGSTGVLGMIDDGSCELALRWDGTGGVRLRAAAQVDLDWFLALRCEQVPNGQPLLSMLRGLGAGCGVSFDILVASAEDPHHTWEGIFRGIGIGLNKLTGAHDTAELAEPAPLSSGQSSALQSSRPEAVVERGWDVMHSTTTGARLRRETAESVVEVELVLGIAPGAECHLAVSDSINVAGITDFLREFALAGNLGIAVGFNATRLSSSHVVTEDIGLALGRALRCIAVERMVAFGINGAGSNINSVDDLSDLAIRVGVSMEGRKFWKFVPFSSDYAAFRKAFLVGHTLPNGLFSEDLDDFVDGLAGGLEASVMVHVASSLDPAIGWPLVFRGLGAALKELLTHNPDRMALAPGVKATLA
jgi:imidazoleglycerol phosphate dehydratase HisB